MNQNSLYIHIPFCKDRCSYCDFFSTALRVEKVPKYMQALMSEIEREASGVEFHTVFIGGGTPTSIPADSLDLFLQHLRATVKLTPNAEITVEANPGTVDAEKAEILAKNGVNRVSMGAQSFHLEILKSMRRIHQPQDVILSMTYLRAAGINNLNLDLIFAYPNQTLDMLKKDLETALSLHPKHLSAYCLSFEEGTDLNRWKEEGKVNAWESDLQAEQYDCLLDTMIGAGFCQYEISNFALPGYECRHNLQYWRNGEYLGLGASAHSHWRGERTARIRALEQYSQLVLSGKSPVVSQEAVNAELMFNDTLMMKLRTMEGIDPLWFERKTGAVFAPVLEKAKTFIEQGFLKMEEGHLRLTRRGFFVSNRILAELI